ncbi:hypothetical protein [[Flexibacter] sp. ATCC 35208]|uniref:hypothetical protein n=1 Tax=[Flexibacter] sp. ATCC 35208 TaxID=1936242 RepID=UPI0009D20634|nr:hypothetical protein [[Flexibacter] sp. ATCC 35208]OMP79718.1 hypothetical protein BW716_08345 [[Flexibacter] sp. ATCC 35208]
MESNLTKELLFLLPVVAIAVSMVLFRKRKKGGPFIVSEPQVPTPKVIQKSIVSTGIILEYKHHCRVAPAPEQSPTSPHFKVEEMYKHDIEQWESHFIRITFSKN